MFEVPSEIWALSRCFTLADEKPPTVQEDVPVCSNASGIRKRSSSSSSPLAVKFLGLFKKRPAVCVCGSDCQPAQCRPPRASWPLLLRAQRSSAAPRHGSPVLGGIALVPSLAAIAALLAGVEVIGTPARSFPHHVMYVLTLHK